jgi:photosystem II stability/assembly factor-like uncharacterized protein
VRFLRGKEIATNRDAVVNRYASDLAISDVANRIYAVYGDALYESRDAGCTWRTRARFPAFADDVASIALASEAYIYVYTERTLARLTSSTTETFSLPERIRKLAADPHDPTHLRAVAVYGASYESWSSGENWDFLGDATSSLVYTAAVDPENFDHVIAATLGSGVVVTNDGGRTWTFTDMRGVNVWEIKFSTVDPRVVWTQGGDSLYRSDDGGRTFLLVLQSSPSIPFTRAVLAPHAHNANIVAISSVNGIAIYHWPDNSAFLIETVRPGALAWSPSDILYFSAPDQVIIVN